MFEDEDGDIFTDGSAYDMDMPTAMAGTAVCQKLVKTGKWKSIRWPVPAYLPQSATIAEMIGLIIAIGPMQRDGKYRVACDCQAALDGAARSNQPPNPKSLWGGLWKQIYETMKGRRIAVEVVKVRAHRTKEQAIEQDDLAWFKGND